ncbi:MAG: hypothetical protein ACXWXF_05410 [Aeromicrobium sp.]
MSALRVRPRGRGARFAESGTPALDGEQASWADVAVPLDAYAGKNIKFRVYYKTDGGVAEQGLFLDDIVGATSTADYDNYYISGNRQDPGVGRSVLAAQGGFDDVAHQRPAGLHPRTGGFAVVR